MKGFVLPFLIHLLSMFVSRNLAHWVAFALHYYSILLAGLFLQLSPWYEIKSFK